MVFIAARKFAHMDEQHSRLIKLFKRSWGRGAWDKVKFKALKNICLQNKACMMCYLQSLKKGLFQQRQLSEITELFKTGSDCSGGSNFQHIDKRPRFVKYKRNTKISYITILNKTLVNITF